MTDFIKLMTDIDEDAILKTTDPKVFVGCALGNLDDNNKRLNIHCEYIQPGKKWRFEKDENNLRNIQKLIPQ